MDRKVDVMKPPNGCGSSYWLARPFRIPKFISSGFWKCCNQHDRMYQRTWRYLDKESIDAELINCMYYSAYNGKKWQRPFLFLIIYITEKALKTKLSQRCFNAARD